MEDKIPQWLGAAIWSGRRLTDLQTAIKDRGLDKMLDEARVDNQDNDVEYMKNGGSSR